MSRIEQLKDFIPNTGRKMLPVDFLRAVIFNRRSFNKEELSALFTFDAMKIGILVYAFIIMPNIPHIPDIPDTTPAKVIALAYAYLSGSKTKPFVDKRIE